MVGRWSCSRSRTGAASSSIGWRRGGERAAGPRAGWRAGGERALHGARRRPLAFTASTATGARRGLRLRRRRQRRAPAHRPEPRVASGGGAVPARALPLRARRGGHRRLGDASCRSRAGQRAPVLLSIHGGPHAQYGVGFFDEFQVYAGAGYAVVFINPRGSRGYGEKFAEAVVGDWGGGDVDDVLAGLDEALRRFDVPRRGAARGAGGQLRRVHDELDRGPHRPLPGRLLGAGRQRPADDVRDQRHRPRVQRGRAGRGDAVGGSGAVRRALAPHLRARASPRRCSSCTRRRTIAAPSSRPSSSSWPSRSSGARCSSCGFPGENHELSRSGTPRHRLERFRIILDWFASYLGGASGKSSRPPASRAC